MSAKFFSNNESLPSSDSDEYHEVFYSSSSRDRSSVGSIPWAEDAIKQNQQEWQRLERMFYSEEELPPDQELRDEIIEWTTAFPHLRIVGQKLEMSGSLRSDSPASDSIDEMIERDLPDEQRFNKNFKFIHPQAKSIFHNFDLSHVLEKDLRISSVPMLSRRRQLADFYANKDDDYNSRKILQFSRPNLLQKLSSGKITRPQFRSSNSLLIASTNNTNKLPLNTSSSAKVVRMPPIVNFVMPQRKYLPPTTAAQFFAATKERPSKSSRPVMLPVLNLDRADLSREMASRSISAALDERELRANYIAHSVSTKISK